MEDWTEELLPLAELTTHVTMVLERIQSGGRPAMVVQGGMPLAVIMEVGQYEQVRREVALLRAILVGERDIRAGQIVSQDDVEVRLNALMAF